MRAQWSSLVPRCALFVAIALGSSPASAQKDTADIYHRIERFAERRKVTQWLYDAVFVEPPDTSERKKAGSPRVTRDPNMRFKGRTIRAIDIRVLDPFGGDVDDTAALAENRLERWGNALHMRTRQGIIRDRLLFAEKEALDPLRLSESERVLRATPMVNDARVRAYPVKGTRDSVDVVVLVQDRWTLDGGLSGDVSSVDGQLIERNLLGSGQQLSQSFRYTLDAQRPDWGGTHRVYSIGDSYVGSTAQYLLQPAQDQVALSLDRPFFSPVAQWAGNASFAHTWLRQQVDTLLDDPPYLPVADQFAVDAWAGWNLAAQSLRKPSDGMAERVVALRYADTWFHLREQGPAWDSAFVGTRTALASFSLGARRYTKDRYLYRFGQTEDVVEGMLWSTTAGLRWQERGSPRPYVGASFTRAAYMGFGDHLSVRLGLGGLIDGGSMRDGVAMVDLDFFSRTFLFGRWRFRQFVRLIGARAIGPSTTGSITISGDQLVGYSRSAWTGSSKFLLRTETVAYMPGSFLGFHFAPVFSIGVGTVTGAGTRPLEGTLQPAIGLGVLIRNEHLLIRSFQVSVAFYPPVFNDVDPWQWDALRSLSLRTADLAPSRPDVITVP